MHPAIIGTVVAMIFLIRALMILVGIYKTPILRKFEEYGPEEKPYLPLLPVLMWSGVLVFSTSLWAVSFRGLGIALNCLGLMLLVAAAAGYNYYERSVKYHLMFLKFPRWYHELIERTTRYERRRIAYMWLHLPRRLRLTYNSSDKFFFIWVDFVIMGTVREEEPKPGDEDFLYTRH